MFSAYSPLVALVLACAPALVAWREYRLLTRGGDAAVFTERIAQARNRIAGASSVATVVILGGFATHAMWAVPTLLVAVAWASHEPRKVLLGETWSFPRYLEFRARGIIGGFGFWILLAFAPTLVASAPTAARWPAAAALAGVLLAWHHFYARILLAVLNATPLHRPDLEPFFAPVFDRTTTAVPTVWRAGAQGGILANAVAMPHPARGRVLFFDTLLERLAPNEVAAILAHEVAHLEHFTPALLRRTYVVTAALVGLIVFGSAALSMTLPVWATPAFVFVALAVRAHRMQAEETRSDRRAVALCGDPEALISALMHLHAIHHLPRRMSNEAEQHSTHPSLARRIRAIRETAAVPVPHALVGPTVLRSSEPGHLAILEPDRFTLVWSAPDTVGLVDDPIGLATRIEARAYSQITELRVITAADGRATLSARSVDGCRWNVPLEPGEAARAQSALNVVDQLFAPPAAARHHVTRAVVGFVMALAATGLKITAPILVPALLALRRPVRPLLLTLASALVTTSFVIGGETRSDAVRALILGLLAAGALYAARRLRSTEDDGANNDFATLRLEVIALAIPVVLALGWLVIGSGDLFGLYTLTREAAWPAASLTALTLYLGLSARRGLRRVSAVCAALTAFVLFAGSSTFLLRVVRDPLVVDVSEFEDRSVALTPVADTVVDGYFEQVRLAPDGRHFLLSEEPDEEESGPRHHVLGSFDGWSREIEAADAVLAGNDRVLLLNRDDSHTKLRAERLRSTVASAWTLDVPGASAFSVAASPDGRWQFMSRRRNAFVRVDGRVGRSSVSRTYWNVDVDPEEYVSLHGSRTGTVGLGVAVDWSTPGLPWWLASWQWTWRSKTTFLSVDGDVNRPLATTNLTVQCADPSIDAAAYVCVGFDGRMSRIWRYEIATGKFEPVGATRGALYLGPQQTDGTLAAMKNGSVVLIDVDAERVTRFVLPAEQARFTAYDFTEQFLVAATPSRDQTALTLYRRPARAVSSDELVAER